MCVTKSQERERSNNHHFLRPQYGPFQHITRSWKLSSKESHGWCWACGIIYFHLKVRYMLFPIILKLVHHPEEVFFRCSDETLIVLEPNCGDKLRDRLNLKFHSYLECTLNDTQNFQNVSISIFGRVWARNQISCTCITLSTPAFYVLIICSLDLYRILKRKTLYPTLNNAKG